MRADRTRGARDPEVGAVAVEFALVVPLLLMLFFGVVTFGLTYNDTLAVNNAVREGARFGAGLDYTTGSWASSVQTRVAQVYFNDASGLDSAKICVDIVDSSGTTLTGSGTSALGSYCTGTAGPAVPTMSSGTCAVRVWVVKPETINWLLAPSSNFDHVGRSIASYGIKAGSCVP